MRRRGAPPRRAPLRCALAAALALAAWCALVPRTRAGRGQRSTSIAVTCDAAATSLVDETATCKADRRGHGPKAERLAPDGPVSFKSDPDRHLLDGCARSAGPQKPKTQRPAKSQYTPNARARTNSQPKYERRRNACPRSAEQRPKPLDSRPARPDDGARQLRAQPWPCSSKPRARSRSQTKQTEHGSAPEGSVKAGRPAPWHLRRPELRTRTGARRRRSGLLDQIHADRTSRVTEHRSLLRTDGTNVHKEATGAAAARRCDQAPTAVTLNCGTAVFVGQAATCTATVTDMLGRNAGSAPDGSSELQLRHRRRQLCPPARHVPLAPIPPPPNRAA